ncbi:hypothetical protein C8J56DRAFT_1157486 [Mycena floridula]|nr:hypothetical protein C8J56DRAFT_1157486 [Mycena floridula]
MLLHSASQSRTSSWRLHSSIDSPAVGNALQALCTGKNNAIAYTFRRYVLQLSRAASPDASPAPTPSIFITASWAHTRLAALSVPSLFGLTFPSIRNPVCPTAPRSIPFDPAPRPTDPWAFSLGAPSKLSDLVPKVQHRTIRRFPVDFAESSSLLRGRMARAKHQPYPMAIFNSSPHLSRHSATINDAVGGNDTIDVELSRCPDGASSSLSKVNFSSLASLLLEKAIALMPFPLYGSGLAQG